MNGAEAVKMTDGFKERAYYVIRALGCLKPYWYLIAGAYFIAFLSNGLAIWMPTVIRSIIDEGIKGGSIPFITRGALLLMAAALCKGLFTFLSGLWTESASQNVAFDFRNKFHTKLQSLSFSFHDESETGQLLTRSVSDVDRLRFLTGRAFLHLIQMITLIVGISAAMLLMNAKLALPTLIIIPFIGFGAAKFSAIFRPLSMKIRDREAILTSRLEQNLRGARIVKAFARESQEYEQFQLLNDKLLDIQKTEARIRSIYLPLLQVFASVGTVIVIMYGGSLAINGELTIGELVAFSAYVTQLMAPIRRLGWVLSAIAQASASAERIFEILDLKSDIQDSPDALCIKTVEGNIRFEDVSFSYSRSSKVIDSMTFEIQAGEKAAFLGGTGSGKSSITNLILRFYDPTHGAIYLDGKDIREVSVQSLRDHVGIVMQDTILFAATVRENIAFGRPDATDEQIVEAAQAAHIHDFIAGQKAGYDTHIAEMGATLSGGQKQRISIARAILKDPEILILDDATSSVDTETESLIQDALQKLMQNRTSIIIAQRLSTIRQADKVFVMDKGRIAAAGLKTAKQTPHDQLIRSSGLYASIYSKQLRPEKLEGATEK